LADGLKLASTKNDNIHRFVNSAEIDIFLTTENNLVWHKLPCNDWLQEQTRGWWESTHVSMAYNMMDKHTGTYQPGGVGAFSINWATHCIHTTGYDPSGLG